jgi:hypothetical protein
MKQRQHKGSTTVEYLLVAAAIFIAWNFVAIVKDGLTSHQAEYTWSISQPNI